MREEIYDYLRQYGFSKEELDFLEEKNEKIYFANISNITNNISFLDNLNLSKKEIISLANSNPLFITTSEKRKQAFNEIYINKLELNSIDIKNMLLINPFIYNLSPIDINVLINDLLKTYSKEELKNIILSNPKILNGIEGGIE